MTGCISTEPRPMLCLKKHKKAYSLSNDCVMRTCMCVVVSVLITLAFSIHHWLAACREKESPVRNFFPGSYSLSCSKTYVAQIWDPPRGDRWKLGTSRPQAKPQGLGGGLALNARHARPTGEWIRPVACKPNPQLWVNNPTALWVTVESQRLWETTQKEIRTDAIR